MFVLIATYIAKRPARHIPWKKSLRHARAEPNGCQQGQSLFSTLKRAGEPAGTTLFGARGALKQECGRKPNNIIRLPYFFTRLLALFTVLLFADYEPSKRTD